MKILMVCLGNICRSPLAEGILRDKVRKCELDIVVDSAGTNRYHIGEAPDPRSIACAEAHGIDISDLRARQFKKADFERFDRIYVMDRSNMSDILALAKNQEERDKVEMILNVNRPNSDMDVPDPYYGGDEGFEHVYKLLDSACEHLLQEWEKESHKA